MPVSLDLTLNSIKIPAFTNYTPPFGTMVTKTEANYGGLSTLEVNENVIAPFVKMRSFTVSDNTTTTNVEFDAKLFIDAASTISLTLARGAYEGCKVTIINSTSFNQTLVPAGYSEPATMLAKSIAKLVWNGTMWRNIAAPAVGKVVVQYPQEEAPGIIYPCTSWEELDYDGAFFRSAGGNADDFIEEGELLQKQLDSTAVNGLRFVGTQKVTSKQTSNPTFSATAKHSHTIKTWVRVYTSSAPTHGVFERVQNGNDIQETLPSKYYYTDTHTPSSNYEGPVSGYHKHSYTPSGTIASQDTETLPKNFTMKVWKRIA